ncbi:hypothetical protein D3C78_950140 [compost metagenome]
MPPPSPKIEPTTPAKIAIKNISITVVVNSASPLLFVLKHLYSITLEHPTISSANYFVTRYIP